MLHVLHVTWSCGEYQAKQNQGDWFSYDQANLGLSFVPFECTQYAHLMHLCGLYP